jgi:hypothetical protein
VPQISPVAPLNGTYAVSGHIRTVSGSTITLKKRDGATTMTVDASPASKNMAIGAPLNPGTAITAAGSSISSDALVADTIYRAKGDTGDLWPPDKP